MSRVVTIAFGMALLLGISPILGMLAATQIAQAAGCTLNEGGIYPCLILGQDWGETLNFLFVAAWFFFLTAPLAIIGAFGLIVIAIVTVIAKLRKLVLPRS